MNLLLAVLVAVAIAETLLYFAAPSLYAIAALVPFGPTRRIVLHPRAAKALRAARFDGATGYRESAAGEIDLGRLELPERLEIDQLVLHFHLGRGSALARLPWSFGKKAYSLLRVDVRATHDAIELRPRFMVMGWPSILVLAPFGVIAVATSLSPDWTRALAFGAIFVGLNVVFGFLFAKPRLASGLDEIQRQIEAALVSAETGI